MHQTFAGHPTLSQLLWQRKVWWNFFNVVLVLSLYLEVDEMVFPRNLWPSTRCTWVLLMARGRWSSCFFLKSTTIGYWYWPPKFCISWALIIILIFKQAIHWIITGWIVQSTKCQKKDHCTFPKPTLLSSCCSFFQKNSKEHSADISTF